MAKDPAFLFYTSDFLVGTITMSNEQVGKYIRLLCLQHQKGKLTIQDFQHYAAENDQAILEKFVFNGGFYYNSRLVDESEKRKKHSEHQKNKAKLRWQYQNDAVAMPDLCRGNAVAMPLENENANENENENENIIKGGSRGGTKIPTLQEVIEQFTYRGHPKEANKFYEYYESSGWRVGKQPMKSWKACMNNWIKNIRDYETTERASTKRIGKADYKQAADQYNFDKYGDTPVGEIFGITRKR